MASENLILRSGTFHVRLVIPKDVRHILNRTEFTESLKTGSKAEAQMKKFAFLQVWKQQIAKARKLVAGPTPEELPEKSFNMSTLIATRQKDGLMNIVTGNQTEELDLSFSPEKFVKIQSHTWDLISNAQPWKTPQEAFESDFDPEGEPPYVEFLKFKEKWYELGEGISLERKIERFNDWIRLNKVMQHYIMTASRPLSVGSHEEIKSILEDPKNFKIKSPFTKSRLEKFSIHQREQKGVIEKTIDMHVSRLEKLKDWIEAANLEISFDSVQLWLESLTDLTPKTKKQYIFSGQSFWKWAMKNDDGFKTQFKTIAPPFEQHEFEVNRMEKRTKLKRKAFTVADVKKLYQACKETKKREILTDLFLIGAHSGARIEEICQLRVEDVIDDEGVLSFDVYKSKTEAGVRYTPVHPAIKPIIERLIKESTDGFLIKSPAGNKYGIRSDAYSKQFGRLKTIAGFNEQFVFHSLRATMITQLHRADVPPITIAAMVGHETGTVTFDVYGEGPSPQQKFEAISKVDYGLEIN
ncbi:tyrosine-type recombinase/integrase [Pseudomonas sp. PA-3-5D]|uniref:site-specific integrase n=5 Tax=Pseudomonas TaxID=286 RepID=UPI001F8E0FDF|nr:MULTISPECIES: site-specific integrase [unclassified Pseudomonas]MCF5510194.1 tyrosine-type recombinase/integrase [Pseudomonas sp. PA-3-6H]MCF5564453.1 tyrosine-type recombinase/integrase [Pseudomonas sp. PA-3-5D]